MESLKEQRTDIVEKFREQERRKKKIALALLEQCKSEDLTVSEFNDVIAILKTKMEQNTYL